MSNYTPSGEKEAITVRPSATSIFAFDSDDRYRTYLQRRTSPTYPFQVLIQKAEALLTGFFKRIGLTEFRLNWTLPNICRGWGNNMINLIYTCAASVTAASGSGTIHTYTCNNSFQAGQIVSVTGLTPAGYNVTNATILTASATQFTTAGTTTGASSGTGTATLGFTASVTAATASTTNGTTIITFSANNNYVAGQLLRQVTGLSPAGFNVQNLRIVSATPTQFVVALPPGTTLSGSSTGTGVALVGLTRQITLSDGFYNTPAAGSYLAQNIQSVIPGFTSSVYDFNEDQIRFLPPIDTGSVGTYQFYFDSVSNPVQYGTGLVTAASGSGTVVTYTCANSFVVGQSVSVTGLNITTGSSLNLTGTITTASPTQFTIASTVVGTSVATQAGTATADARASQPNVSLESRQLIDMLTIPYATQYYSFNTGNIMICGVPNMRPTDYIDVISNQLTMNQNLRDSSSLPNTRDLLTRIYLDNGVNSQYNVETTTYGIATPTTLTITALQSLTDNIAVFTSSTAVTAAMLNTPCVMSNITGGSGWNGTGTIISTDTTTPFAIAVAYDAAPTGTPSFSGSSSVVVYTSNNTLSRPNSVWDDRVNGVTPFTIYRQFNNPKQIRWSSKQPLSNCVFELFDDQGRSIQDLFNAAYPLRVGGVLSSVGTAYANSFVWNATCLLSED